MMRKPNKARGEVALTLGGEELILCAEMERLAALEDACNMGLTSMMQALADHRFSVIKAGLISLTIEGDPEKALANVTGADWMPEAQGAIMAALIPDREGNARAGAGKA